MSRSIRSYPQSMRQMVVDRRMRQYTLDQKEKRGSGNGTLAALDYYTKHLGKALPKPKKKAKKESPSDIRRREKRAKK